MDLLHFSQRFKIFFNDCRRSVVYCKPTWSFVWSRLNAPVELFTPYTTADVVLEIDSTSDTAVYRPTLS